MLSVYGAEGLVPIVIVTGERGNGDSTSKAAVSQRYLVWRGIPKM